MTTPRELLARYTSQAQMSSFFIDTMGIINVKSYGAKGDGVTDDTVKIQVAVDAAIANGNHDLYFPHGIYKVTALTGTSTLTFIGDNSSFIGGYIGAINNLGTNLAQVNSMSINVKYPPIPMVNAVGDGVTDDTVAIQNIINYVGLNGKGVVFFPVSNYLISDDLLVTYGNVMLLGASCNLSILKVANNATGISHGVLWISGDYVTVDNLGFDGNIANNTALSISGIFGVSTLGLTIRNCKIKDCIFNGITLVASYASGPNQDYSIYNNHIENMGWEGIHVEYSQIGKIKDNRIITTGYSSIEIIYVLGEGTTTYSTDVDITGNYVNRAVSPSHILTGNVESGFMICYSSGDKRITIEDNICYDNRHAAQDGIGINQDGLLLYEDILISNNIVSYAGLFGIDVPNCGIVEGNIVNYPAVSGIRLATDLGGNSSNVIVDGNLVYNCNGDYGIYMANDSGIPGSQFNNIKINNNTVVDDRTGVDQKTLYGFGVSFTNAVVNDIEVSNNNFKQVKTQSIVFNGGTSATITFNNNILKTPVSFGARPMVRVYNSVPIATVSGVSKSPTFDSERYDTDTLHDLITLPQLFTARVAGVYRVGACVVFDANAVGIRYAALNYNGTVVIASQSQPAVTTAGLTTGISIETEYYLNAGDHMVLNVYQDSGGALNVTPEFYMSKVD